MAKYHDGVGHGWSQGWAQVDEFSVVSLALVFQNSALSRDMDDDAIEELVAVIAAVGKPGFGARRRSLRS